MIIKKQKGLTLVELTVYTALLAIVYFIAIPHYHNFKAKKEAQAIPHILHQHLIQAKQLAFIHRNNLVICPSLDLEHCTTDQWHSGFILFLDQNQNKKRDSNEVILNTYQTNLKYGTLLWKGSLNFQAVTFQGDTGLPRGSIGSFYYCSSQLDLQHRIVLNMVGTIRTESQNNKC
ncbi:GspH/FimT family pseudopilin [Acinetobacter sp. MD2]|uniref:GspH/FimT family pseudopilin n=1 Tax=Acinetobacter sp. MD2 TaxID=2600066 RepID=UPI002D1F12AF|nr:GspH/FimT family pseudopilin [Acinetobacter sp. MD2]MEB3767984.1 GspH/FimT family pseudopilin [Acinetobacter sp. MD2]